MCRTCVRVYRVDGLVSTAFPLLCKGNPRRLNRNPRRLNRDPRRSRRLAILNSPGFEQCPRQCIPELGARTEPQDSQLRQGNPRLLNGNPCLLNGNPRLLNGNPCLLNGNPRLLNESERLGTTRPCTHPATAPGPRPPLAARTP